MAMTSAARPVTLMSWHPNGLIDVVMEILHQWATHFPELVPWLALWFGIHLLVEFVVPSALPNIYNSLGRDGKLTTRAARARDARTKAVAVVQACIVVVGALYGRFVSRSWDALRADAYTSTPLSHTLSLAASAYFLWDIVICIVDKLSIEWHVHAWLCFVVFTASLVR